MATNSVAIIVYVGRFYKLGRVDFVGYFELFEIDTKATEI